MKIESPTPGIIHDPSKEPGGCPPSLILFQKVKEKVNGVDLETVKPRAYKRRKAVGAAMSTAGTVALGAVAAAGALLIL